ncbi:hypothetical protein Hypma_004464 [Hypsizygus marmoreus]|uniref:Transmembrane protein n=1 Tax=Hypsizygus marmoreus TaxID=39966 RepID=A0A369JYD9_HYPMA|nr:hypothetical protein Hypma_004464 [Hypsizygus marmoreus]
MSGRLRRIVIDDSDSGIRYSGQGWFQDSGSQDKFGNFGPTYQHTSHGTNANDSFSFSFEGTSVAVFGTTHLVKVDNGTRFDPTWECFVDNVSIGATDPFEFPENNWTLCRWNSLSDGPHTITVNVTTTGSTFWFDSLRFTPSPSASYDSAVLAVENDDPRIFYDSKWMALGGNANFTTEAGSQMKYQFTGTSLSWVGYIPTELPHNSSSGTYSIDGGSPVTFRLEGLPAGGTVTVYNQVFFSTPELAPGPHSILVTYTGNRQLTPLTLDYLYITSTSSPQTTSDPSSSSPSTSISPSSTVNPSSTSEVKQNSDPPVGAIVGGVIGGIAIIAAILFFFWWRRRKHHRVAHELGRDENTFNRAPDVTPFMAAYQSAPQPYKSAPQPPLPMAPAFSMPGNESQISSYQASSRQPTNNTSNVSHTHTMSMSSSEPSNSSASGYVSGTVAQSRAIRKGQEANLQPLRPTSAVVHQDSGLRLPQRDGVIEDIPPIYTAA